MTSIKQAVENLNMSILSPPQRIENPTVGEFEELLRKLGFRGDSRFVPYVKNAITDLFLGAMGENNIGTQMIPSNSIHIGIYKNKLEDIVVRYEYYTPKGMIVRPVGKEGSDLFSTCRLIDVKAVTPEGDKIVLDVHDDYGERVWTLDKDFYRDRLE